MLGLPIDPPTEASRPSGSSSAGSPAALGAQLERERRGRRARPTRRPHDLAFARARHAGGAPVRAALPRADRGPRGDRAAARRPPRADAAAGRGRAAGAGARVVEPAAGQQLPLFVPQAARDARLAWQLARLAIAFGADRVRRIELDRSRGAAGRDALAVGAGRRARVAGGGARAGPASGPQPRMTAVTACASTRRSRRSSTPPGALVAFRGTAGASRSRCATAGASRSSGGASRSPATTSRSSAGAGWRSSTWTGWMGHGISSACMTDRTRWTDSNIRANPCGVPERQVAGRPMAAETTNRTRNRAITNRSAARFRGCVDCTSAVSPKPTTAVGLRSW